MEDGLSSLVAFLIELIFRAFLAGTGILVIKALSFGQINVTVAPPSSGWSSGTLKVKTVHDTLYVGVGICVFVGALFWTIVVLVALFTVGAFDG